MQTHLCGAGFLGLPIMDKGTRGSDDEAVIIVARAERTQPRRCSSGRRVAR